MYYLGNRLRVRDAIGEILMTPKHPRDYLWYLASPYSNALEGIEHAYEQACFAAALLIRQDINVFSPIAHTHHIAQIGDLPVKSDFWKRFDEPFVNLCDGIIVLKLHWWDRSRGVAHEIKCFEEAHKPIFYMEPGEVPWALQNLVKE
jgi:hypothetical protein